MKTLQLKILYEQKQLYLKKDSQGTSSMKVDIMIAVY